MFMELGSGPGYIHPVHQEKINICIHHGENLADLNVHSNYLLLMNIIRK